MDISGAKSIVENTMPKTLLAKAVWRDWPNLKSWAMLPYSFRKNWTSLTVQPIMWWLLRTLAAVSPPRSTNLSAWRWESTVSWCSKLADLSTSLDQFKRFKWPNCYKMNQLFTKFLKINHLKIVVYQNLLFLLKKCVPILNKFSLKFCIYFFYHSGISIQMPNTSSSCMEIWD